MFKINRKVEYALISLKHMSQKSPGQLTTAKEICALYKVPFDTTSRVLQIMAQNGLLKAEQGAHGGYQVLRDLSKLTLSDLTKIITGPIEIASCFHKDHTQCDITACCNVIGPMLNLNDEITQLFKTIRISELLESRHQNETEIRESQILGQ